MRERGVFSRFVHRGRASQARHSLAAKVIRMTGLCHLSSKSLHLDVVLSLEQVTVLATQSTLKSEIAYPICAFACQLTLRRTGPSNRIPCFS